MLKNPFVHPKMTLWWGLDSSLRSRVHESHTRSQYRSRHFRAKGAQVAQTAFFQWDSQNRKFGGEISKKRRNMLPNPLEVPKRTLWWGLHSSLRSRVAHTEPISVTGPRGPRGPKRHFFNGTRKIENLEVTYQQND